MNKSKKKSKIPFYRKKIFLWPVGIILGLIIVTMLAFRVSPWPGALVIRSVFSKDAHSKLVALEAHLTKKPVSVVQDQQYRSNDTDAKLDVYFPQEIASTATKLPVVIWTHGGAWLSGDKTDVAPYFKLLAEQGFTVVAVNYTLAPEKTYPTPVFQLNDAHRYIIQNAERFHIDSNKMFLAGDSAGSQLSSQLAALITNPAYAVEVGISPSLTATQLKGVILNCGIYKMEGLSQPDPTPSKLIGWGNDVTVWAYTGTHDFLKDPDIRQMSAYYHVTKDFPATYITGGNGDPLTDAQSKPFTTKLQSLGVKVTTLFFPSDHKPSLPHEYQFNLDNGDGQQAFSEMISFLEEKSQ
ncbi:MAG: alpha/beta hydrolase [Candidatus Saccharibacteria bacterium]